MKLIIMSIVTILMVCLTTRIVSSETLFFDNFNDNKLNSDYLTDYPQNSDGADGKPEWVEEDGVLKQTVLSSGDPTYCILTNHDLPASIGLQAKVRFDDWQQDHGRSRTGLGVWQDENDFHNGYAFVVRGSLEVDNVRFLNDRLAWNNVTFESFALDVGQWFYMKMFINADEKRIYGKIWYANAAEPENWTMEDDYTTFGTEREPISLVGLCGGAGSSAGGLSTCSFDDFYVFDDGGIVLAVEPTDKLTTTWGQIKN